MNRNIAFGARNYYIGEHLNDPSYIRYEVKITEMDQSIKTEGYWGKFTYIPTHICTQEDYDRFAPVEPKSASFVNKLKA